MLPAAVVVADDVAVYRGIAACARASCGGAAMMAALIFVASLATLWMFFVSYCRSLMASSSRHPLSAEVRDMTGIRTVASAGDYRRIMQLLQLCPERQEDRTNSRR